MLRFFQNLSQSVCGGATLLLSTPPPSTFNSSPLVQAPSGQHPQSLSIYSASANIGDFIIITVNETSRVIYYNNVTNGLSGQGSYTENEGGWLTITSEDSAIECAIILPSQYILMILNNTGPTHDVVSLVSGLFGHPISKADLLNKTYIYNQFRVSGGPEIGCVQIDGDGIIAHSGFSPCQAIREPNEHDPYPGLLISNGEGGGINVMDGVYGPSQAYLTLVDDNPDDRNADNHIHVFGLGENMDRLYIDLISGNLLMNKQPETRDFNADMLNTTFVGIFYGRWNTNTGENNTEIGDMIRGITVITFEGTQEVPTVSFAPEIATAPEAIDLFDGATSVTLQPFGDWFIEFPNALAHFPVNPQTSFNGEFTGFINENSQVFVTVSSDSVSFKIFRKLTDEQDPYLYSYIIGNSVLLSAP
jgi:hypothetical protein